MILVQNFKAVVDAGGAKRGSPGLLIRAPFLWSFDSARISSTDKIAFDLGWNPASSSEEGGGASLDRRSTPLFVLFLQLNSGAGVIAPSLV